MRDCDYNKACGAWYMKQLKVLYFEYIHIMSDSHTMTKGTKPPVLKSRVGWNEYLRARTGYLKLNKETRQPFLVLRYSTVAY